jgi:hypothetical protein
MMDLQNRSVGFVALAHKYDQGHWMHVKFNLRPYWEKEVKCVINGLKGSLLAGFDDIPMLSVKFCV